MLGIALQASDDTYNNQGKYDRGHLLPFGIYSFDENHARSTNTFTNAVPQHSGFNSGLWRDSETTIREDLLTECAGDHADLYAITGVTLFAQYLDPNIRNANPQSTYDFLRGIRVPRAMWTAVCCVRLDGTVVSSTAFVGNNVKDQTGVRVRMTELSVINLQAFILRDMQHINPAVNAINLFPGVQNCQQ